MSGAIIDAITHAVAAAKLRAYVRENEQDGPLRGLENLAERHSRASASALRKVEPPHE